MVAPQDQPYEPLMLSKGPHLAIFDIKSRWQEVAIDVVLAMCCNIPGLGLFFALWLFRKYVFIKDRLRNSNFGKAVFDGIVWFVVLLNPILNCQAAYIQYGYWSEGTLDLETILKSAQIRMLTSAIYIGSGIGRIILDCHTEEMATAVSHHLKEEYSDMCKTNEKAAGLLAELQKHFSSIFKPPNSDDQATNSTNLLCLDRLMLNISSLLMVCGMVWMQITDGKELYEKIYDHHDGHPFSKGFDLGPTTVQLPTYPIFWANLFIVTFQVTLNWRGMMAKILIAISVKMKDNRHQLLLFTALTAPSDKWNSVWSAEDMEFFQNQRILRVHIEEKEEQSELKEHQVRRSLEEMLAEPGMTKKGFCLDLKVKGDADAWWRLRQYVQIDFLNESVAMEFIGVIMMMLFLCFGFVAFVNWLVNDHECSSGLSLLAVLSVVLLITMCKVFNACVAMNHLWENDQQVLSRATLDALIVEDEKAAAILRAMQNKVEIFDNRQELFGLVVTKNLRNGWMLTIATLLVSSAWEVARPMIEHADVEQLEQSFKQLSNSSVGEILHFSQHG